MLACYIWLKLDLKKILKRNALFFSLFKSGICHHCQCSDQIMAQRPKDKTHLEKQSSNQKSWGGGVNWYFICKLHIRSDKQTARAAFPQLPIGTGGREGIQNWPTWLRVPSTSDLSAENVTFSVWDEIPQGDYKKDIFSTVSATDQAENSWSGKIKCVLSKLSFHFLFKGLSLEIATSELQKFSNFLLLHFWRGRSRKSYWQVWICIFDNGFLCQLMLGGHHYPSYCFSSC